MMDPKKPYYHSTIKRLIAIFGSVFNDVHFTSDHGEIKKVPLFYSPREKFLVDRAELADMYRINAQQPYPRMGFEMVGLNYASERKRNTLNKIRSEIAGSMWQWERVPYDFSFNLYVASKTMETALKIVEQIMPIFSPSFNVTVNEVEGFNTETDVAIVLNSCSPDVDYMGPVDEDRTIIWTLNFTLKAYLYNNTNRNGVIKETITKMSTSEIDLQFIKMTSEVVPRDANKNEPHIVVDKIEGEY